VGNIEIESRMSLSLVCNCHSDLQRLAVRAKDGSWKLSDRAKLVTVDDAVFEQTRGPTVERSHCG
jgi:hypothetical protein